MLTAQRTKSRLTKSRVPLALIAALVLAALAATPVTGSASAPAGPPQVCGNLAPDEAYQAEVGAIGMDHACEHLKGRKWNQAPRAHSEVTSRVASAAVEAPEEVGSWSTAVNPGTKTIGISSALFHTGKVLMLGGKYRSTDKNTAGYLFDPVTQTGHEVPAPAAVFCGAITFLSDGRMLSAGGADPVPKGIVDLWLFDVDGEVWTKQPDSPLGRYYPTSTRLADGRILIAAGNQLNGTTKNPTVEIYTPPAPGTTMGTLDVVGPAHVTNFYPHQWLMPDGKLLQVEGTKSYRFDLANETWTNLPSLPSPSGQGSGSLHLPGGPSGSNRVMIIGGTVKSVGQRRTFSFDHANPSRGWSAGTAMPTARAHMNVVQVPDGSAFGIGGNSTKLYDDGQRQTMAYNPATDTWTNLAIQTPRRAYHSTALLLPDGRIMSAGDTGAGGGRQLIDFYSPPYLFKGARPVITSAPATVGYNSSFAIGTGPEATKAVLMAPAATTHAVEMNARRVELAVTRTATGFTAVAPTPAVAPPGYYMLFTVTADGVPSTAKWVHVGP
jgi:hypothetical protein